MMNRIVDLKYSKNSERNLKSAKKIKILILGTVVDTEDYLLLIYNE